MKSLKTTLIALCILISVSFCACAKTTDTQQPTASPGESAVMEENVVKNRGGDMFIAMPAEIESFDPLAAKEEDLINLLSLIYESPLKYDSTGKLQPCLAESWEVNESKTVFTFHLRENVAFSDGVVKLTAEDVIKSAERVMALDGFSLENASSGDGEEETPENEDDPEEEETPEEDQPDDTQQSEEFKSRYGQFSQYVQSMKEVNSTTVELTMREPGNMALHFMTFPVVHQVPEAGDVPVGTGMYRVTSYQPGEEMVLEQNSFWWQEPPYIEKIVAKPVTDTQQKLEFVETSIIDFATTDVLSSEKYKQLGKTQVIDYMTSFYDCIIPNLIVDELKDVNVRQAISLGLDRREILSTVLLNHGVPTNLPIAPDFFAYNSKYKISDYDSNRARELLEEAGYVTEEDGEGRKLVLTMIVPDERNAAYKKEAAKAIKKQLGKLFIEVEVEELPDEEYIEKLSTGNYDLAYCSFYLDIVPNIAFMFEDGGSANYGHVQNEEITNRIEACNLAVTEQEMTDAYGELQRVLTERVPQIGLYYKMNSIICDESIQDIKNVRQNMIFDTLPQWYNAYLTDAVQTTQVQNQNSGQEEPAEDSQDNAGETEAGE